MVRPRENTFVLDSMADFERNKAEYLAYQESQSAEDRQIIDFESLPLQKIAPATETITRLVADDTQITGPRKKDLTVRLARNLVKWAARYDNGEWRSSAECNDPKYPADAMYPKTLGIKAAQAVCRRCVVRNQCLGDALYRGDEWGVRGGMSERERRKLWLHLRTLGVVEAKEE